MSKKTLAVLACLICVPLSHGSSQEVELILSTAGPQSDIGVPGQPLSAMYSFSLSPDGRWWAGEFELDNVVDAIHLRGSGTSFTDVIWIEGDALPGMSGTFDGSSQDRQTSIDNLGVVVGTARRSLAGTVSPLVYRFDDGLSLVAIEGQLIPAIATARYDNVLHSPNVMANGLAGFVAENITLAGDVVADDEISLVNDGISLGGQQKGVTSYGAELLQNFNDEQYFVNSNGFFLFAGDTDGATASDDIVVFGELGTDGTVVLREDTTPISVPNGTEPFDTVSQVHLAPNNDWYVLGDTNGQGLATEVAIRNGQVLAAEGQLAPDGFEYAQPIALTGDQDGNFAWIWETTNPDLDRNTVLVYNGSKLLLSEGDVIQFDYDNDGQDEPAVIEFLHLDARNLAIGGGYVYLMVEVDQPDTTFIGNAFIRIPVFVLGDVNQDGEVNLLDVQPFVDLLTDGTYQVEADANGDGLVNLLDVASFVSLLSGGG